MTTVIETARPRWGLAGFALGTIAILLAIMTIAQLFGQPQPSAGTSIGELAAEIRQAAQAKITGAPRPEVSTSPSPTYVRDTVTIIAYVLAALALGSAAVSIYRGEPTLLAKFAITLGLSAIVMQYAFWLVLVICGMMIISAIIYSIGDILG